LPYTIVVDLELHPNSVEQFVELVMANAQSSLKNELGCRRFEVHRVPDNPSRIVLYEMYDDRGAFERHLAMPHFGKFDEASKRLVVSKSVTELQKVN
jgi:autoinducer 2-degrading protein